MAWNARSDFLFLGERDSVNWYVTPFSWCTRKHPYLLTKLLSVCQKDYKMKNVCITTQNVNSLVPCCYCVSGMQHCILVSATSLSDASSLISCHDVSDDHTFSVSLKPPLSTTSCLGGVLELSEISVERKWPRLALLSFSYKPFPVSHSLISVIHIAPSPCALHFLALVSGSSFYRVLDISVK